MSDGDLTWLGALGSWSSGLAAVAFLWKLLFSGEPFDPIWTVGGLTILLFISAAPSGRHRAIAPLDLLASAVVVATLMYRGDALPRLVETDATLNATDLAVALAFLLTAAEAGRRVAGWPAAALAVGWFGALVLRPSLPAIFRGDAIDLGYLVIRLFYSPEGPFGAPATALLLDYLPVALFASVFLVSGALPALADRLGRFGGSGAAFVAAPFVLEAPAGQARPRRLKPAIWWLAPLIPPAVGLAPVLVAQSQGISTGDVAGRLVAPGLLAIAVAALPLTIGTLRLGGMAPGRGIARDGLLVAGPIVLLLGLASKANFGPPFLGGAFLLAVGAGARSPTWKTFVAVLSGVVDSARIAVFGGSLVVFVATIGGLERLSGLFAASGGMLFETAPAAVALAGVALLLGFAATPPAGAAALLILLPPEIGSERLAVVVAGLFWILAGAYLSIEWRSRLFRPAGLGRLRDAAPILLAAIVSTRSAFYSVPDGALPLGIIIDGLAALLVGWALVRKGSVRLESRILALVAGALLFAPGPEWVAAGLISALAVIGLGLLRIRGEQGPWLTRFASLVLGSDIREQ